MASIKIRPNVFVMSLLAATLFTATPAAASGAAQPTHLNRPARSGVALPMVCPEPKDPKAVQVMVDIDSAFAHQAANWTSPAVGRVIKFQCFDVVGRNKNAEWLLIPFGTVQAWLHGSMVRFRGDLMSLPLTENVVTRTSLSTALPKGLPTITARMRAIYQQAARAGKLLNLFTVMGDCNSEAAVYLGRFAAGGFDAGAFPSLKNTVLWFSPSYTRTSVATHGSFNAGMAFDTTWTDPKTCNADEGPLACELRVSRASIIVIAVGTGDQHEWQSFEGKFRAILDYTLKAGVLPVLMTKADALESQEGGAPEGYINDVIRRLGREYGVPVIDFWLATRGLPNNGLAEERNSSLQVTNSFHLNEQGMDMRMLMTLQTLKAIANR
jgi:hypothetical protein